MFPVEAFRDSLVKAITLFDRHKIRFHLTGGITTIVYGEPRMTQDIDVVICNEAISNCLDSFVASLDESDFMFDVESVRHAVDNRGMFQLFDNTEALKLDIYPRELVAGELGRSEQVEVFEGMFIPVASRVDAVVSKLVWISKGSHKSRRDLRQLVRTATDSDRKLIREFSKRLDLVSLLEQVLEESDELLD